MIAAPAWAFVALALFVALKLRKRAGYGCKEDGFHRCPACGYDLRATPDRCPECGAMPKEVSA